MSLCIALILLLSVPFPCALAEDTQEAVHTKRFELLEALGIDEGINTDAQALVTRAEFVAMAVRCLNHNGLDMYDGSFTVKSGIFTGEIGVMSKTATAHPKLKITKATLYDGIEHLHSYDDTGDYDFAGLKAFFADGSVMFDENGKYIDITDEKYWYKL